MFITTSRISRYAVFTQSPETDLGVYAGSLVEARQIARDSGLRLFSVRCKGKLEWKPRYVPPPTANQRQPSKNPGGWRGVYCYVNDPSPDTIARMKAEIRDAKEAAGHHSRPRPRPVYKLRLPRAC